MNGYLYYYKRTVYPVDADYYNISQGVAGYKQPQNKGLLLIAGTQDDLDDYLEISQAHTTQRRLGRTNRLPLD